MRIIAGEWGGRRLLAPPGDDTRPTADRTRETLFSMLTSRLGDFEGLKVADFFAGSGALGLEALSRGAATCLFAEQDPAALKIIAHNVAALKAREKCDVRAESVLSLGKAKAPLDLVLMDPPYGTGAGAVALDKLNRFGWFAPSCWIVIETAKDEKIDVDGFEIETERRVGKAKLTFLRPDS